MQTFVADISTGAVPQILRVKQGDSQSRFFRLTVTDGSEAWQPPEDVLFTVRFATDKGSGWYDTIQLPGGSTRPAVEAQGNVLTVEVAMQATAGDGELCVVANSATGYQLAAWNLTIKAEAVPGADSPEAEHYYGIMAEQIAQGAQDASAAAASAAAAEKSAEDAKQSALAAKGHTIQDGDGTAMEQRATLQFVGFQVNDDPSGKTVVSPKTAGDTKNVAGYVGEITVFADNQLRENHVWADGGTIDPAKWPDLAAYAATAGWQTDSSSGWYKTPVLSGTLYSTGFDAPTLNAQIRAKVDEITAKVVEVNGDTLGGFEDGQFLKQENGKLVGATDPTVPFAKAVITAKNGFTVNSRGYVVSYGAVYICNVDIKVPSSISAGWVDVFTTDLPACTSVTVRLQRGEKDEAHAESRDFQFHGNRLEVYLEAEDAGITLLGTIVSYKTP